MTQLPIYHTSGQGCTGPDPAVAAEVQWASPELDARIGLILAGFPDPVHPLKRCQRQRKPRRPNVATLIKQAEKAGRTVTSVTVDGITLHFGSEPTEAMNPWLADIEKATKQ